ncbi:outer membrane protein assembly factor [Amylibacter marinus]|uniref:Outer membrane protein assembly factor n=1 Tax=Amylibacter marinus TaxID=1475483 RepID=A0ABQ5VSC4_9RHOB|nr:BamA/TamA family outer membrane protein [Amylibacter marinus]GLQ34230.1 outer membrane protein assembly factor [Amylibacter marinus]
MRFHVAAICRVLGGAWLALGSPVGAQSLEFDVDAPADVQEQVRNVSVLIQSLRDSSVDDEQIITSARSDYARILSVLYENGYYAGEISIRVDGREVAGITPLERVSGIESVEIRVTSGAQFHFGRADITPRAPRAPRQGGFRSGAIARSVAVQEGLDEALSAWKQQGYPLVHVVDQTLVAQHKTQILDVLIRLDPGGRARFGRLNIQGHSRMRENRVRKIAGLVSGEIYSTSALNRAAQRLRDTGIFSSVVFEEADHLNADASYDITLIVEEAKLRRIEAGATLSNVEGLKFEGDWLHRNVLGGGEQVKFGLTAAGIGGETEGIDYSANLQVLRPATLSADTNATVEFSILRQNEPEYILRSRSVSVRFDHYISEKLSAGIALNYVDANSFDIYGERDFSVVSLPLGITYDGRDSKTSSTSGAYVALSARPFYGRGNGGFGLQAGFDGRIYRALGSNVVLAARAQASSIYSSELSEVSPDYLLYSGGGNTVRGQDYQALGVEVDGLGKSGGLSYAGASVEIRFGLWDSIGGIVFADYGYVGSTSQLLGAGAGHSGAGIGLRYETGLGPIRLDIGAPLGRDDPDSLKFYLGVGQAF